MKTLGEQLVGAKRRQLSRIFTVLVCLHSPSRGKTANVKRAWLCPS